MQASEAPKLTIEEKQNFSKLPLSEKVKLTKQSILNELEETQGISPKTVNMGTNYLLEVIDQFLYYKEQCEIYFNLYCKQKMKIHELEKQIKEVAQ